MYHISKEDELEPRITPKPACKLDCFTVPSVPEVSLIFDKPLDCKVIDHADFQSKSKCFMGKENITSSANDKGSYAAWKEQNYLRKPSRNTESLLPQRISSNQNCNIQTYFSEDIPTDCLREPVQRNYIPNKHFYSSTKHNMQETYDDKSCKHNYRMCEDNVTHVEGRTVKSQYNHRVNNANVTSNMLRTKPDNYVGRENNYSPQHERKLIAHNSGPHKMLINDSVKQPTVQSMPVDPNTSNRNEFQLPQYLGQQSYNPYFNVNSYPFPQLQPYPNHSTDSQETVKNLLQIINSQNEQIKSLQTQVDRLLKMQEENLKEKKMYSCSQVQHQNEQFAQSTDATGSSNYAMVPKSLKRDTYQSESLIDKKKEIFYDNDCIKQNEPVLPEGQSKKAFMEQKVSIGVMTSFEFTVQNSPFTVDVDEYEKNDSHQKETNFKMCNASVPFCDTNDSLRRYKNTFGRMPSAQLENIVEDSESYMSSSQQQSSNLNTTVSLKDLEKQAYTDSRKEMDTRRSESPKLCKNTIRKVNKNENRTQKHLERISNEHMKNCEITKTPVVQTKTGDYNMPTNSNTKMDSPSNTNQRAKINMQKESSSVKTSNSVNGSTNYHKSHQPEGQIGVAKQTNCVEDSLIFNSGDLKINERPPSPEPSIHVDMHEYSSDDDSEKVKRSSKVGWTFYNNVLGQVNQLLHNSGVKDDQQQNQTRMNHQVDRDETENKAVLDTVKVATLEQLKKLGISLSENPEAKDLNNSNKMAFDLSFYPRLDYQTNVTNATSAVNETNTSMHMKALALKYLTDEQLAELAIQRQGSTSVKHLMVSNVQGTNMSFATMRYLERYQLLPGKNVQTEDISKVQVEMPQKTDLKPPNPKNSPALHRYPFSQTPRTTCPSKILDISTLKQQPKLL